MREPKLEAALHDLEVTANNFAMRYISMAQVRTAYVQQIREMSAATRAAVEAGDLTAVRGAEVAREMRNEILEMQRLRDMDFGRSLARQKKAQGISMETAIERAMTKLGLKGRAFHTLSDAEQRQVYLQVIESAGKSDAITTAKIPRLRNAERVLWLATLLIAAYNIGTSENPWWQTGREAANIAGGAGGGFAGGAAMGAAVGIWGGPIGVGIGVVVGGVLGALLADRVYVEAAGTSDPTTRAFVARFTSFWSGVDEDGMARALATEHRNNAAFMHRVFVSLNDSYSSDADDVALAYTAIARRDSVVTQTIRGNRILRDYLIKMMSEGWTSSEEQAAITHLRGL